MTGFDQESIVYGYIREIPHADAAISQQRHRVNRAKLLSLPRAFNDEWPFFCSSMFAMPGSDALEGSYHSRLIYFAASYRAIERVWNEWMASFESLLQQMYWTSVTVHLSTETRGKHVFHWEAKKQAHIPGESGFDRVDCEWERELAFS